MTDPSIILGIEPGATADQIREAYNKKRAELSAMEGTDGSVPTQIQALDDAFAHMIEGTKLALAPTYPPKPPVDSILFMVNGLDAPIQESSENILYHPCPYCGNQNPVQSAICTACGKQISRPCPNCGKQIFLGQTVCPRCNTVIREHDQSRLADALNTQQRVQDERLENSVRVDAQEKAHLKRAGFGCLLWLGIALAIMLVVSVGIYAVYYFGTQR
jgi:hypothetical protein